MKSAEVFCSLDGVSLLKVVAARKPPEKCPQRPKAIRHEAMSNPPTAAGLLRTVSLLRIGSSTNFQVKNETAMTTTMIKADNSTPGPLGKNLLEKAKAG
jgi:hypothetical protein